MSYSVGTVYTRPYFWHKVWSSSFYENPAPEKQSKNVHSTQIIFLLSILLSFSKYNSRVKIDKGDKINGFNYIFMNFLLIIPSYIVEIFSA